VEHSARIGTEEADYQVTMANTIRAKKKVPRRDRARLRNARCNDTGVLDGWCAMRTPSRARHRLYCDQVRRRQRRGGAQQAGGAGGQSGEGVSSDALAGATIGENQDGTAPSMPPPQAEENEEEEQQEQEEEQKQKPPARAPRRCPLHLTLTAEIDVGRKMSIVIIIIMQTVNDE
jgi:hypothetical protein